MRRFLPAILLVAAALPADGPVSLADSLEKELAAHLPLIGLKTRALKFKRDPVDAAGRLPVCDQALADPIGHVRWIQKTEISWGKAGVTDLAHEAGKLLQLKPHREETPPSSPLAVFAANERREIDELVRSVPEAVRAPLGRLLAAMKVHRDRRLEVDWSISRWRGLRAQVDEAYTDPTGVRSNDQDVKAFLAIKPTVVDALLVEDLHLLRALQALRASLDGLRTTGLAQGKKLYDTPLGWVAIGGPGDDIHDRPCALIIDFGGDDRYTASCAAANPDLPSSFVVDLAGDDIYRSDGPSQGSGLFGCGVLWDVAGDDSYGSGRLSQGCGALGLGLLIDEKGDDTYTARRTSQAHAAWGLGLLIDLGGRDVYKGGTFCQALARTRGIAILQDRAGEDHYILGDEKLHKPLFNDRFTTMGQGIGYGYRYQNLAGGLGVLHDLGGNDVYTSDIYGQGAGYWFGSGQLWDRSGNDRYQCVQYGIGAGIHLASGYLYDRAGRDTYHLYSGIGVGGAHDFAVGVLLDVSGNDQYIAHSTAMGGAINNSVAILADWSGDDAYMILAPHGRTAAAKPSRKMPSLGLQLDLSGKDQYRKGFGDDQVRGTRTHSLAVDVNSEPKDGDE